MDRSSITIPAAIVFSAILVAGAIYFSNASPRGAVVATDNTLEQAAPTPIDGPAQPIAPITQDDHIRGNPNAVIKIVEYSDYDCPFCTQFHETLQRIMDEYGEDSKVAWIYRHYPLTSLHPNAFAIAEAAECVAALGGNEAFWKFSDSVFGSKNVNEMTDMARLPEFAAAAGVDGAKFSQCRVNGTYRQNVQDDAQDAVNSGGNGTPHSVVVVGDKQAIISGAQPYTTVKGIIDSLLLQAEGGQ